MMPPHETTDVSSLAERVFPLVFRTDLAAPGFALIALPPETPSAELRRLMLALADKISGIYQERFGRRLAPLSMVHFDQQVSTKFHLDGGPDESYLLLGYEASPVHSELTMADYTAAAQDAGLDPANYLEAHNPLLPDGERRLAPYVTALTEFAPAQRPHLVLINNSRLPLDTTGRNPLGVLHRGYIPKPDPEQTRIIYSVMLAPLSDGSAERISLVEREAFLQAA